MPFDKPYLAELQFRLAIISVGEETSVIILYIS